MLAISVSASVMIVAVLFMRLFRSYIPVQIFHFLWTMIAIRLLIPIEFPSQFNFIYLLLILQPSSINNLAYDFDFPFQALTSRQSLHLPNPEQMITVNRAFTAENVVQLVWFVGFLLCSIYFISVYLRHKNNLTKNFLLTTLNKKDLPEVPTKLRRFDVKISPMGSSPISFGIVQPIIMIPSQLLHDKETLQFVFLHEMTHIQHFDSFKKILLIALGCIYWFNPFIWVMIVYANQDIEKYCDLSVLKQVGQTNKKRYALALLEVAESDWILSKHLFANFNSSAIEERIKNIMQNKKASKAAIVVSLIFITAITTAFATTPYKTPIVDKPFIVEDIEAFQQSANEHTKDNASENSNSISLSSPLKNGALGKIDGSLTLELAYELSYSASEGTPAYAPVSGVVVQVQEQVQWPFGRHVVIQCSDNLFVAVTHLETTLPTLKVGDSVDNSIQIGTSGITGNVSKPMVGVSVFSGSSFTDKTQLNLSQWPSDFLQQVS